MILYHGSKEIVEFPEIRIARYNKDSGLLGYWRSI